MGVRGLWSYLNSDPNNFTDCKLHNTNIVIDGENFVYTCYSNPELPYHYGGEYFSYRKYVEYFIDQFQLCNIRPIFIFGGCQPKQGSKLKKLLKRSTNMMQNLDTFLCEMVYAVDIDQNVTQIEIMPRLILTIFIEILKERNILYLVCECEGDLTVAELALYLGCPAVSGDSDFYIYRPPSEKLYQLITIDSLKPQIKQFELDNSTLAEVPSTYYMPCQMLNTLGPFYFLNYDVLPVLAVLIGNDTVSDIRSPEDLFWALRSDLTYHTYNYKRIRVIIEWVQKYSGRLEELFIEILYLYNDSALENIVGLICQGMLDYALDINVSGHNAAYLLGLTSGNLRKSTLTTSFSFELHNTGDENRKAAAMFLKDIVLYKLNSIKQYSEVNELNEDENSLFHRWPKNLIEAFRTMKIAPPLLNALYVSSGVPLRILFEDLQIPSSINTCLIELRKLHCGLMMGLEVFLDNNSKLSGLHDDKFVQYNRHQHVGITKQIIAVEPVLGESDMPPLVLCLSVFKHFLNIDIDVNVERIEHQGLSLLMSLWFKHSSCAKHYSSGISSSSVGLAVLCCTIAAMSNYRYLTAQKKSNQDLYALFESQTEQAKERYSIHRKAVYCIKYVHQINELQLMIVELTHLIALLNILCPFYSNKEDVNQMNSIKTTLGFPPIWLVFTNCRLIYWISSFLEDVGPDERFRNARDGWLPNLLLKDNRSRTEMGSVQREMITLLKLIDKYIEN